MADLKLSQLLVPSLESEIDYPGLRGFKLKLAFVTRDELVKLRKKATTTKINKRTRQPEDDVDSDLFQELYIEKIIKGWSGLTLKHLSTLVPMDLAGHKEEEELPYSQDSAELLMKNSSDFDAFVTDTLEDIANFTKTNESK